MSGKSDENSTDKKKINLTSMLKKTADGLSFWDIASHHCVQFFIGPLTHEDEAMTQSRTARQRTLSDRVQYPRRT